MAIAGLLLAGCGGGGGTTVSDPGGPIACGFVPGQITTSVGSAAGNGGLTITFASGKGIGFSNLNLTFFSRTVNSSVTGYQTQTKSVIVDLGDVCLDEIGGFPGGGTDLTLTAFVGHAYVAEFTTTFTPFGGNPPRGPEYFVAAFTVDNYNDGVITVTYRTDY